MRYMRATVYVSFSAICLSLAYLAFISWSPAVYLHINPIIMPIYFVVTLILFLIIIKEKSPLSRGDKLLVVIIHSFLTRIVSMIVLYPGISGDPTAHLGRERTWDITGQYYLLFWPEPLAELQSLVGRMYTVHRGAVQYGLVVSLSKILSIDIFWVHTATLAVLWSLFVPILAFKISKTLGGSDRASLLAPCLTASAPGSIGWSFTSTTNSFGFFFFFVTIYLLLRALRSNANFRDTLMLFLVVVVVMWIHSLTGIVALSVVLLAFGLKNYHSLKRKSSILALPLMFLSFTVFVMLPAAMSIALKYIYPIGAPYFSFEKIFTFDIYHLVFAKYADYTMVQTLLYGGLMVLGIIGMVVHGQKGKKRLLCLSLILAFITISLQYRILVYFVENPIFGTHRLLTFLPFITAPFAGISLDHLYTRFVSSFSPVTKLESSIKHISAIKYGFVQKQMAVAFIVSIGLSALIVDGNLEIFRDVARYGPVGTDSVYSMKAAKLIHEEYLSSGERYVVIADIISWDTGIGVVGTMNINELYLTKGSNQDLYIRTLKETSIAPAEEAAQVNNASLVYIMTVEWSVDRYLGKSADYQSILQSLSKNYEQFAVVGSGDGQIRVFRWRVRWEPFEGIGPEVSVIKDSELVNLNTTYSYKTLENVTHTLTLTGASTYNVSNWPKHWSYEQISPAPINLSLDADRYINFTANPALNYNIKWFDNEFYQNVVWKDDAFKSGWYIHHGYGSYSFTSDGDVAIESIEAEHGKYLLYQKDLPSVQGASLLVARLKGTPNAQFTISLWNGTGTQRKELFYRPYHECPYSYTLFVYSLPTNTTWTRIWLVSRTTDGNLATVYWDYVMLLYD